MQRNIVSISELRVMRFPHPDRTATRGANYSAPWGPTDWEWRVWPSREKMARVIRAEEERGVGLSCGDEGSPWRAVQGLSDGEGY